MFSLLYLATKACVRMARVKTWFDGRLRNTK